MKKDSKKFRYILFLTGLAILFFLIFHKDSNNSTENFSSDQKKIELIDGNMTFELKSKAITVGDFFKEQKIEIKENDLVIPGKDEKIFSGMHIFIKRAKNITII